MVATGEDWGSTIARAEMAVACVVRKIADLGLRVATHKTEALSFYDRASGRPPEIRLRIGNTSVLVGDRLKYLGLLLDGSWRFGHHFDAPRVQRVATALARLLPNLGGPDGHVRRMYIVNSVVLYGAPIWTDELAAMRNAVKKFRRIHRSMAARVTRAYRTVSHAAVTVLAGWPPLEFLARMWKEMYEQEGELRREHNITLSSKTRKAIRLHARQSMMERWCTHLSDLQTAGQRIVGAIRPCLDEWADRVQGEVTYRLTQVLTGHGCFDEYLYRKMGTHRAVPPLPRGERCGAAHSGGISRVGRAAPYPNKCGWARPLAADHCN